MTKTEINVGNASASLYFHPFFEDNYKALGDYVVLPKEIRILKGTDEYQEQIEKISEMLKDRLAEEIKKYMTVVVRDEKSDVNTVGVRVYVKIEEGP